MRLPMCARSRITKQQERRFSMNKAWTQILVPLLIAATEAILEVIKVLKKKGKTVS